MQLRDQFNLTHGLVEIGYPAQMSADDIKDFEDALAIMIRIMRQRNAGVLDTGQGAGGTVRLNGAPGSRSAA